MKILLLLLMLSPLNIFSEDSSIKVINGYNKTYQEILSLRNVQKDTAIIFSVSWCGPCKRLKENLENSDKIDSKTAEIIYVISDLDETGKRPNKGKPGEKLDNDLNSLGQTCWPFILLFSNAIKDPIFIFPSKKSKKEPYPNLEFYEEIEWFFNSSY